MSLFTDIQAATAKVDDLKQQLTAAQTQLDNLLAAQVKGGPDVSEYQGDIDWTKVKGANYEFAIVRANDGDKLDTRYSQARIKSMRDAGLIVGTYSFSRPASALNGLRNGYIECAMDVWIAWQGGALRKGDLPLAYDFENDSIAGLDVTICKDQLIIWIKTYSVLLGHKPIIYTNRSTITTVVTVMTATEKALVASCPLWIADPSATTAPIVPEPWKSAGKDWLLWQKAPITVPGITTGKADINAFSGSMTDLQAMLIQG